MGFIRETLRHSAIYSAANLLGKLTSFIMLPFYAHIFEAEGYGIIALLDASIGFLSTAFANGSYNAIIRIYHEEPLPQKSLVIGTGIWTVWGLGLLCIPLPAVASPWITAFLLGNAEYWPLFVLALLSFVVSMGGQSASTFLVIRQQSALYSLVNLTQLILGLTLNIFLVIYLRVGLIGIFISSLISASVSSLIFHWVAIREHGLHYNSEIGLKIRMFWFPLIPGDLIAYISRQVESFLVRFIISLEGVGILEMAYKFPPLINLIIAHPFLRAWRTKSLEIGSNPGAPKEIGSMFTLYLFLMLFAGVFLAANIGTILAIMVPPEFSPATRIAQIEIATTVVASAGTYLMFGLLYSKQTKAITRIRIVTAPLKILLSVVLIMFAGLAGAAYSGFIMEAVILIWIYRKAQRAYRLPLEYYKIIILVGIAVALVKLIDQVPEYAVGLLHRLETSVFEDLISFLVSTPLGTWRSGKLIEILNERTAEFARLTVDSCLCLLYGILIVVVKPNFMRLDNIPLISSICRAIYIRRLK